jgi:hypothetical protein
MRVFLRLLTLLLACGLSTFTADATLVIASGSKYYGAPSDPPSGFTMPLGIPDVPAGLEVDTALPTPPSPWNTSTANWYYVKQGGVAVDNGTPAAPRGTFPTLCAGCFIVLDNTATLSVTNLTLNFSAGTSGSRVWLIGSGQVGLGSGSTRAQISHTGDVTITGDHFYIDGLRFHAANQNQIGVAFGSASATIDIALIRDTEISGTGVVRSGNSGNAMQGVNSSTPSQFVVFYQTSWHDIGAWDPASLGSDIDCHCFQINNDVQDIWILESEFYHCQGDGIQFTAAGDATPFANFAERVYVGRSTAYENLQAGFWFKHGDDLIFSENTVYNQNQRAGIGAGTGDPIGMGGQYDFAEVWFIANRIYDTDNPIRFASVSNTLRSVIYLVGNVITNANWAGSVNANSANTGGSAIAFWQGGTCRVVGNTIWKFVGQGIASTPGVCSAMILESNIINGRTSGSMHDIFLEGGGGWTNVRARNNMFDPSPRLHTNGTTRTSIATFHSDDSSNRANNVANSASFVSAVNGVGDFDTQSGSPARDAGTINTDVYATYNTQYSVDIRKDFVGTARPQNTLYDIGAYEH